MSSDQIVAVPSITGRLAGPPLSFIGGAWVPMFLFPEWMQKATLVMPTRWAIDGLEAMTWRGLGASAALAPIAVMLGFAVLFGFLAVARFRWESEG